MTKDIGNTTRDQAKKNFKKANPDNERFCAMCGLVVPLDIADNFSQLTSNKLNDKFWLIHVSYVCINCNCTTSIVYSTEQDPVPFQDEIGLYAK